MLYFLLSVIIILLSVVVFFLYIGLYEPYLSDRRNAIYSDVVKERQLMKLIQDKDLKL
jgi:hypothetical protein